MKLEPQESTDRYPGYHCVTEMIMKMLLSTMQSVFHGTRLNLLNVLPTKSKCRRSSIESYSLLSKYILDPDSASALSICIALQCVAILFYLQSAASMMSK